MLTKQLDQHRERGSGRIIEEPQEMVAIWRLSGRQAPAVKIRTRIRLA
jgi:hypothetical protein